MDALEGEITDESGVVGIETLVAAVGNGLSRQGSVPDAYIVNTAGIALTYLEDSSCRCGDGSFGHRLHRLTVDVGNSRCSATYVQGEVMPVVVDVVHIAEHRTQLRLDRLRTACDRTFVGIQRQLSVLEVSTHAAGHFHQRSVLVAGYILVAAEPKLHSEVIRRSRCEGRQVHLHRLVLRQLHRQVAVIDIPAFRRHLHVARTGLVNQRRAMPLVHAPVAYQAGRIGSLQLLTTLVEFVNSLRDVP